MGRLFAKGRLGDLFWGCLATAPGLWVSSFENGAFYSRGFLVPRFVSILIVILGFQICANTNRKAIESDET